MLEKSNRRLRFTAGFLFAGAVFCTPALAEEGQPTPVQLAQAVADDVNDPLEDINRAIFQANEFFYDMFLRGPTEIYLGIVPPPLRSAVSNMLNNIATPVILANDLLQAEWERAGTTTQRFAINTTYGIGGMFDRASEMGIDRHSEDFGQTLAVWGVPEPFYLVLPVLGPSNPRDALGRLFVDMYFDPLGLYMDNIDHDTGIWGRRLTAGVNEFGGVKNELDQIKKTSVDYYAAIRSMYRQKRNSEIRNGAEADLPPIPDLGYDLDGGDTDAPQPAATDGKSGDELGGDPAANAQEGTPLS